MEDRLPMPSIQPVGAPHQSWALCTLFLALLVVGAGQPVHAQTWKQTTVTQTTVTDDGPVRRFLDTLTTRLRTGDSLQVRRIPNAPRVPLDSLRADLVKDGVGIVSTNAVAVHTRFALESSRLVEEIQGIQFYCRLPRTGSRVPLLYVSAEHPLIRDGTSSFSDSFSERPSGADPLDVPRLLRFPYLAKHPQRQPTVYSTTKRQRPIRTRFLMRQLTKLVYERGYSYVARPN